MLGVAFRPGGTWPFFDPAADELQNQHIALRDLWGSAGDTLRERVLAAPTPHAKLQLLEAELLRTGDSAAAATRRSRFRHRSADARAAGSTRSRC